MFGEKKRKKVSSPTGVCKIKDKNFEMVSKLFGPPAPPNSKLMNGSACGLAGCVFFFAGRRTPTHCSFNFELGGGGGATLQTEKIFCLLFCRRRNKIQVKTRDGCSTDAARSSGHPCPRCIIFPFTAQRPPMPNASSSHPQQRSPMPIQRRGLRHDFQ